MWWRGAGAALSAAAVASAAVLVVGLPNLAGAAAFFAGGVPTPGQADAVVGLACWTALLLVILYGASALLPLHRLRSTRHRLAPASLLFGAALLMLVLALAHRSSQPSLCCVGPAQAQRVAQLLH